MNEEIEALQSQGTWELVSCPHASTVVGCRWVFAIKYPPNGSIDRYKARLVAKDFIQTFGVDYVETFSPIACLNSIRVILSLSINQACELHQFDVKNAFLYRDLEE